MYSASYIIFVKRRAPRRKGSAQPGEKLPSSNMGSEREPERRDFGGPRHPLQVPHGSCDGVSDDCVVDDMSGAVGMRSR